MCGGDENRAAWVSSLTDEEPLVIVEARIDIVWEVVQENCGDGRCSVIWKRETSLRCGGRGGVLEWAFGAENRDVSRGWGGSIHQGSEVFVPRGSDEDVVRVNGDVFVERGEEKGVENFLSDLRRGGGHCRWGWNN